MTGRKGAIMTLQERSIKLGAAREEFLNSMSVEELKKDLLENSELSLTDSRKLERNISRNLVERMWKKYNQISHPYEEAYFLIVRGYDALEHTLYELFDGEEYGLNFFDRIVEEMNTDFSTLEKEGRMFAKKRATEILQEYAKYDAEDVDEYVGNIDPMGDKIQARKKEFYKKLETLKRWSALQ